MSSLSILDLAFVRQGGTPAETFKHTLELAQAAERWGYKRFWVAEHHSIEGVASSATSVLLGYLAGGTSSIRIGSGGIMLPNHAPLVIAEQFGTLETLYPGRVDLGLGRAPGGDPRTTYALRRTLQGDDFEQEVGELRGYFGRGGAVRAIPGEGLEIPIYLLGSSDFSARMAAREGLPFAFASHFAPAMLDAAVQLYRGGFRPSEQCPKPHLMVAANAVVADTDEEAARLFTTLQQQFLKMITNRRSGLSAPVDSMDRLWSASERAAVERMISVSLVGSPSTVKRQTEALIERTGADELIVTGPIYDPAARLRSFELLATACRELVPTHT